MFVRQLNMPITSLKGVGKKVAESYASLGVSMCSDLLLLSPRTYEDRTAIVPLGGLRDGQCKHDRSGRRPQLFRRFA